MADFDKSIRSFDSTTNLGRMKATFFEFIHLVYAEMEKKYDMEYILIIERPITIFQIVFVHIISGIASI